MNTITYKTNKKANIFVILLVLFMILMILFVNSQLTAMKAVISHENFCERTCKNLIFYIKCTSPTIVKLSFSISWISLLICARTDHCFELIMCGSCTPDCIKTTTGDSGVANGSGTAILHKKCD
jgi:uncharacterized membrane protein